MILNDKVVVVVGGSRGFGKELAKTLVGEGAHVAIVSKSKETLEATAQEIGATAYAADVRNEQELRDAAKFIIEKLGPIDIWVNSAGLFMKFPPVELIDSDRAHELFDVNFFGAMFGSRTALLNMKDGGAIINILSSAALDASRSVGAKLYAASKWALRGYIDALRAENADNPVKILSVYPGGMKTHLHDESQPADMANFMQPSYVVKKVIDNLKLDDPEKDLIIKRPKAI